MLAAAIASGCGDPDRTPAGGEPDVMLAPGDSLYVRGQFDSARALWREALSAADVAGTASEARLHTWIGLSAMRLGDYAEAREAGERGLDLARQLALPVDVAQAQNALGLLAWHEGRLQDAATLLESALAGFEGTSDAAGMVRAWNNLGLVRYDLGRFDQARQAFTVALDSARAIGNERSEGRVLTNLGMLEIWDGDPVRSLDLLEVARARATNADDVVGLSNALGQTGVAHMILGQPGLALAVLDSALTVARSNGMRDEEANTLIVTAGIYADAGDAEQALRAYAAARRINVDLGLAIETGSALRDEAMLRATRGALDAARRDVIEALELHRGAGATREELLDLLVLADIDRRSGESVAAEARVGEARQVVQDLGSAHARLALALTEARIADDAGDAARTLRIIADAGADLPHGGPAAEAEANALRLRAWSTLGRLDSAVVAGRRAVAAVEAVRAGFASGPLRTSYVADRSRVYADLVMALLGQGETEQAFAVADAARGRAIMEHLSAARDGVLRGSAVRELADAERLLRRIDQLLSQLVREDAVPPSERNPAHASVSDELLQHLERARSEYAALLIRAAERDRARLIGARATNTAQVRAALRDDEALLEFLATSDRLFTFVVTRDSVSVTDRAVTWHELAHQVQLARELVASPEPTGSDFAVMQALHQLLIAPVLSTVATGRIRHLIIVPHGTLTYLAFAALRDADTGRILAEDFAISHLPSAGALSLLRGRRPAPASPGAVAFAPFPRQLPSTAAEVAAFRRSVTGAVVRSGERADEAAVRRALIEGRLVHVASHGVLNARNPLFSRVELARGRGGPADDGRLEIHELLDIDIASPLVFLSGCQTGLGSAWATAFDQGEDYATLGQAFLYAGASSVIATLWRIDDEGAASFAERFYGHLRNRPAAEALAAAQLDMRSSERWSSPYYWAAYTLTGAEPAAHAQIAMPAAVK